MRHDDLRRPPPPEELAGALHDRVHREVGKVRTAQVGKRGDGTPTGALPTPEPDTVTGETPGEPPVGDYARAKRKCLDEILHITAYAEIFRDWLGVPAEEAWAYAERGLTVGDVERIVRATRQATSASDSPPMGITPPATPE